MADGFAKTLSDVDTRSAQFVRQGVQGVDVLGAAKGLVTAGVEKVEDVKEAEETSTALSAFQERRTQLNADVLDVNSKIQNIQSQIANATDREVVVELTGKLQRLQKGGLQGKGLTALRARRGQLMSQFMATYPTLRQDFLAIDKVISGQDNNVAAPTSTGFDQAQAERAAKKQQAAMHGISVEAVDRNIQTNMTLEFEKAEREKALLAGKKSFGAVSAVTNNYGSQYMTGLHTQLNTALNELRGMGDAEGKLPAAAVLELKAKFKADLRANPQINSYFASLSSNYDPETITQQRNNLYNMVDTYVDTLLDSKDALSHLENMRSISEEVAIGRLMENMPTAMQAIVGVDPQSIGKILLETYPRMINVMQRNGGTTTLLQQKYELSLQDPNNPETEDLGMALQLAKNFGSVPAFIEHYTSLWSGAGKQLGFVKGNPAVDQVAAQTGAEVASDVASTNPEMSGLIMGDIIADASKGNVPVLRNMLTDNTVSMARNNPNIHKAIKNSSRVWVIRSGDALGQEFGQENLQFSFTPQVQPTTVRNRGLGRRVNEPSPAFNATSNTQFLSKDTRDQLKALNYTYAYMHKVEGPEAADKWASSTMEELTQIGNKKRELYLTNSGKIEVIRGKLRFLDANIYMKPEEKAARRADLNAQLDQAFAEVMKQLEAEGVVQSEAQDNEQ